MEDPACFVTLVHGTWARRTGWMKEDALFQTELRKRVGHDVQIRNFVWSGKNRQGARLKAADQLAVHLEGLTSENPGAAHFVVGHSHGGSVALYSMLKPGIAERIDGVICLSAPFILVRERFVGTILRMPTTMAICAGAALALVIAWAMMLVGSPGHPPTILLPIGGFLLFVPYLIRWIFWGNAEFECERRLRRKLIDRYRLPELAEDRLLLVRVAGDEASAGLAVAQFVSRFSTLAAGAPHDLAYAAVNSLEKYGSGEGLRHRIATVVAAILAVGLQFLVYVGGVIAGLLMIPVCLILAPFGADAILLGPFLDLSVEVAPPGSWRIIQYEPNRRTGGLYHSRVYADIRVLETVGHWIRERTLAKARR